jgi:hypothetical protein
MNQKRTILRLPGALKEHPPSLPILTFRSNGMAGKKQRRSGSAPRAPDGRKYHLSELVCAAVALQSDFHRPSLRLMIPLVYRTAFDVSTEHANKTDNHSLLFELHATSWHCVISGLLATRFGDEICNLRKPVNVGQHQKSHVCNVETLRRELLTPDPLE